MTIRPSRWGRGIPALLAGPALLLCILLLPAAPAAAHPLDVYLQATYLTVSPTALTVEMDLSPGVLVAPRIIQQLDANSDREISKMEARRYLGQVVQDAVVRVDDRSMPLTVTKVHVPPYATIQAGYGTMRVFGTTSRTAVTTGQHQVFFRNGFSDVEVTYQVNAFVAEGAPITLEDQRRDATQRAATVSYTFDASAASAAGSGKTVADAQQAKSTPTEGSLVGYLDSPSVSVWAILLAIGAAALLGARGTR
jgi:nickel/cobalt transporter (NicO) family protein